MDIEGKSFYLQDSKPQHRTTKKELKGLLRAIVTGVEDDNEVKDVKIDKMEIKHRTNPIKVCNCITFTNVYMDREVLNALANGLEAILKTPFFLYAAGEPKLHVSDDYQLRLDAIVAPKITALPSD